MNRPKQATAALLATVWALAGCSDDTDTKPKFDASKMIVHLADNHYWPAVEALDSDAKELFSATKAWCGAVGTADETAKHDVAKQAWQGVMGVWQRVELMKIGPLAANAGSLRDDIYSWPAASPCAVDQGVAKVRLEPNFQLQDALTNWRGLDALEYLLFAPSLDTQCPEAAKPPQWDGLSKAERLKARCTYAELVAANVGGHIATLKHAWSESGDNYRGKLKIIGSNGAFPDSKKAENAVSDTLFYLDRMTRDRKLGGPAGLFTNPCATKDTACPEALESRWAHLGKQHVLANIEAFEQVFSGTSADGKKGDGFTTHLASVGQQKLGERMLSDLGAAKEAVKAIPGSIHVAIVSDREKVVAAHAAVKKVTDALKTEFLLAVSLDIPAEAAGDAD